MAVVEWEFRDGCWYVTTGELPEDYGDIRAAKFDLELGAVFSTTSSMGVGPSCSLNEPFLISDYECKCCECPTPKFSLLDGLCPTCRGMGRTATRVVRPEEFMQDSTLDSRSVKDQAIDLLKKATQPYGVGQTERDTAVKKALELLEE
jgi:hypothetical protein